MDDEEDEKYLEAAEKFEAEHNFRFEVWFFQFSQSLAFHVKALKELQIPRQSKKCTKIYTLSQTGSLGFKNFGSFFVLKCRLYKVLQLQETALQVKNPWNAKCK